MGREQARAAGRLVAGRPFHRVFVSPQHQARETCELAGYGTQAVIEPLLVEWDYGEFEGSPTDRPGSVDRGGICFAMAPQAASSRRRSSRGPISWSA